MKSKKSFFNQGIIRQDFRLHGWIGIIYLLCLLFIVPLEILQMASRDYVNYKEFVNYFYINTELQVIFLFSIPIAAGLLLYRYIQNEASVDMIHSLPIRREAIFLNHLISGLLLLVVPVIVTSIVTYFATRSVEQFDSILTASELLTWTGIYIILTCLLFSITVVIGMMTGMSSAQAILTYIVLFLPIGLVTLILYNLSFMLYGFSPIFIEEKLKYLSIFHRYVELYNNPMPFSLIETSIYFGLTIVFFIIGLLLYKARHLERATNVIVFPLLRPVFKYGMTFCSMLLGGSYFSSTTSFQWGWITFGYISGAFLGYIIGEMILQKSWRIFHYRTFTGFIGYSIIIVVILFCIKTDVIHYEKKLPRMDQISEVYIGDRYALDEPFNEADDLFSDSKMYIQDIRNLHEYIIDEKDLLLDTKDDQKMYVGEILIAYRLNNGKLFYREYLIPYELIKEKLKPIFETEDYKKNLPEYKALQDKINTITFSPSDPIGKPITISNDKDIKELKAILAEELLSQSFDELLYEPMSWGYMELQQPPQMDRENQYNYNTISWNRSFDKLSSWLEQKGLLADAHIQLEHIKNAEVTKVDVNPNEVDVYDIESLFQMGVEIHTVTDIKIHEKLLDNSIDYPDNSHYYVRFSLTNGKYWYVTLNDRQVPAEIINLFK